MKTMVNMTLKSAAPRANRRLPVQSAHEMLVSSSRKLQCQVANNQVGQARWAACGGMQ